MAHWTPAKLTDRFNSLSTTTWDVFLRVGKAASQRPVRARFSVVCVFSGGEEDLPVSPKAENRNRLRQSTTGAKVRNIEKGADREVCPNDISSSVIQF